MEIFSVPIIEMDTGIIQLVLQETDKIMNTAGTAPAVQQAVNTLINSVLNAQSIIPSLRADWVSITTSGFSAKELPQVLLLLFKSKTFVQGITATGITITSEVLEHVTYAIVMGFMIESKIPYNIIEDVEYVYAHIWKLVTLSLPNIFNSCVAKIKSVNCCC